MLNRAITLFVIFCIFPASILSPAEKIQHSRLFGTWRLLYRGGYGYSFTFQKNYQSICVIHLNTSAVVFKGIYTFEGDDALRINIYEMKNDASASYPPAGAGFTKTSSTYFVFRASFTGPAASPVLVLIPTRCVIDGRSSDGYFEPEIRLSRSP